MRARTFVSLLGLLVTYDAVRQIITAVEWSHQGGVFFGGLDLMAGLLLFVAGRNAR